MGNCQFKSENEQDNIKSNITTSIISLYLNFTNQCNHLRLNLNKDFDI
jgi:hypothetical protein